MLIMVAGCGCSGFYKELLDNYMVIMVIVSSEMGMCMRLTVR